MSHIAILMCTYNGAEYLQAQLDSIANQSHQDWSLHVSDDGSRDRTLEIIEAFRETHPNHTVKIYNGPKKGFSQNFQSLMMRDEIQADAFAFADQDDIWFENKLKSGWNCLASEKAVLYGSRTILVDNDLKKFGESPLFSKPPSFQNALVQSMMGGNTMMINAAAMEIVRKAGVQDVISHDWWLYILISGAGGEVIYEPEAYMLYRQHGENLVGTNLGFAAKWHRFKQLMSYEYAKWNHSNVSALESNSDLLTLDAHNLIQGFRDLRRQKGLKALNKLRDLGLYRQTKIGQFALYLAAFIQRV